MLVSNEKLNSASYPELFERSIISLIEPTDSKRGMNTASVIPRAEHQRAK